ncbi:armadillo repeat-containing protein 10-like isoform X2 [Patiria miniata]|uniref:Armadillo repeat-containing domain-containing protein n=1 Tax=Patiria miniata TaxID=46514 RepID=A0A914B114_PATMI|nr:armadillo repeat-containing protein 10-like isoform X2 [Patiria miniata]
MAAPMSFFPRIIIGATTFTVVVAGALYLYYRSRYIFKRKPSDTVSASTSEQHLAKDKSRALGSPNTEREISVVSLIKLLDTNDESQLCKVLTTIANKAAFTEGQNAVWFAGGLPVIIRLLGRDSDRVRTCTASCIANLSLNSHNQPVLKACIPTLLSLSTDPLHTKGLRLASIQALVNLSVSGRCGEYFSQPSALQSLFELLGDGSSSLGQQALRVLVNLSADETVVPALLSFEVPTDFASLLASHHPPESLLRTLSFLVNLRRAILATPVRTTSESASQDFSSLFTGGTRALRVAVETLMHHGNADVEQQARRLLVMLSGP